MSSGRAAKSLLPGYTRCLLILMLVCNCAVYNGARLISGSWEHYCFQLPADGLVPLLPWTVTIYFGCFAFWAVNYTLATKYGREEAYHFAAAEIMGKLICFCFFIAVPTTVIRPDITGTLLFDQALDLLYRMDAADNLFPSIHCFASWMCFIGVRGNPKISSWYKAYSCVFALSVCISTLTTKQHVFVDAIAGVFLAELCYSSTWQFTILAKENSV